MGRIKIYIRMSLLFPLRHNVISRPLFQLLKCLLSGLFTNCAWARTGAGVVGQAGGGKYVTASGAAASIHPASVLFPTRPPLPALLYTELLHTRRSYLVTVSAIQPHWLHQVAPDYARRCRANRWHTVRPIHRAVWIRHDNTLWIVQREMWLTSLKLSLRCHLIGV